MKYIIIILLLFNIAQAQSVEYSVKTVNGTGANAAGNIVVSGTSVGDSVKRNTDSIASHNVRIGAVTVSNAGKADSATSWKTGGNYNVTAGEYIGSNNNASLRFRTNGVQRMVVDSTGLAANINSWYFGNTTSSLSIGYDVGATTSFANRHASGAVALLAGAGLDGTARFILAPNGNILAPSTTSFGIGSTTPSASALLDLTSSSKGLLIPRPTTTQKNAISSPATNLMVMDATTNTLNAYDGSAWYEVGRKDNMLKALQAIGSTIVAETVYGISNTGNALALTATRAIWVACYIDRSTTVTGVTFYQDATGVYTAQNYNGVGLYSYNAGTMTLIDSSTRDDNIWKTTVSTWGQKAFAGGARVLTPGLYYVAVLWNASATTTAPQLTGIVGTSALPPLATNSAKIFGTDLYPSKKYIFRI